MSLQPGGCISAEDNRALLERYLLEVWGDRNPDAEVRFLAPHYRRYLSPIEPPLDRFGQVERERHFMTAFPDVTVEAHHIFADERRVAMTATARGTHLGDWSGFPPTGRRFEVSVVSLRHIEDGRFVIEWTNPDRLDLAQQLGLSLTTGG